jgi:hypothetical protein
MTSFLPVSLSKCFDISVSRTRGPEGREPASDNPHRRQQAEAVAVHPDRRAEYLRLAF